MTSLLTAPPQGGAPDGPVHPPGPAAGRRRGVKSARGIALVSVALALLLVFHSVLPGNIGSAIGTALPWLGLGVPVLVAVAVVRGAGRSWMLAGAPLLVWAIIFVPQFIALDVLAPVPAADQLTVASQNVEADSGTAAISGIALADAGADVIALEELTAAARFQASEALATSHPYSYTVGTVGLWSIYPIDNLRALTLGLSWKRALAADVHTPAGVVRVYVIHAASIRPGKQDDRDTMLAELAATIEADGAERVIALGDFNASSADPALRSLGALLNEPNQSSPSLGFTWPTALPLARIDHIFERGLDATSHRVIDAGDSDHRAVIARFNL